CLYFGYAIVRVLLCLSVRFLFCLFFFNDTATTEIYTLSLHDALPIYFRQIVEVRENAVGVLVAIVESFFGELLIAVTGIDPKERSEEHTSELQSLRHLVCRLLLEKKKKKQIVIIILTKCVRQHNKLST